MILTPSASRARTYRWFAVSAILLSALFAYSPVLSNRFLNADDELIFTAIDEKVDAQLDRGGFMPLGRLLYALIYRIDGPNPQPYHAVSLLFHAASAVLLFFVILRLLEAGTKRAGDLESGRIISSAAASIVFAVHPVHAEAIGVASSVNDVAAAFLFLSAVYCYLLSATDAPRGRRWLIASAALQLLCALTRWTAVSLPIVIIALDIYPLKRIGRSGHWFSRAERRIWLEKIPFMLIAAATVLLIAQGKLEARHFSSTYEAVFRPGAIATGALFYFWKWIYPGELSLYYVLDHSKELIGLPGWACLLLVGAVLAGLMKAGKRVPAGWVAFVCYLAPIAPTLVSATNGYVTGHNRYTYIPYMSLSAAFAAVMLWAWKRWSPERSLFGLLPCAAALLAAACFGAQARSLGSGWHDQRRLWAPGIRGNLNAFFAHTQLGILRMREKRYAAALDHFRRQLSSHPGDEQARRLAEQCGAAEAALQDNAGVAFAPKGMTAQAADSFSRAIAVKPDYARAYYNMGVLLYRQNRTDEAIGYFEQALKLDPRNEDARNILNALGSRVDGSTGGGRRRE